jgi:hypothetical protein
MPDCDIRDKKPFDQAVDSRRIAVLYFSNCLDDLVEVCGTGSRSRARRSRGPPQTVRSQKATASGTESFTRPNAVVALPKK